MSRNEPGLKTERFFVAGANVDEMATAISSVSPFSSVTALNRQQVSFEMEVLSTAALSVGTFRNDGDILIECGNPQEKVQVFFPQQGSSIIRTNGREMLLTPTNGIVVDSSLQKTVHQVGPQRYIGISFDRRSLYLRLSELLDNPIRSNIEFRPEIDLSTGVGLTLMLLVKTTYEGLKNGTLGKSPVALGNLTDAMSQILLESQPHRFSRDLARQVSHVQPRHVKRAIDYMRAHLSRPITLEEIARASGVSSRTLQQGFRDFKTTRPMEYLKRLRLEAVRDELKDTGHGQHVADVALKWGFVHLGRFAADYRSRFGESPSQALRRAQLNVDRSIG